MTELSEAQAGSLLERLKSRHPVVRQTSAPERIAKLRRLQEAIQQRAGAIQEALLADFGKPPLESCLTEIYSVLEEIRHALRHLRKWMRPRRQWSRLDFALIRSYVWYEPRGVILLIGPWNYPFALTLSPLVAAVAAGNSVVVKPSELTPRTSQLIEALIADTFPSDEVAVVQGAVPTSQALLAQPFDHFFFTGSVPVGKAVMAAAARHLTSVTLELGGKSPTLLDETADLGAACERIAWGKFLNGGQTCVAPDYALVPRSIEAAFVDGIDSAVRRFFGDSDEARRRSPDMARIINGRNLERIRALVEQSVAQGARVAFGGQADAAHRYLAPTVLTGVTPDMPIMQEEIFGPVLPVLAYDDLSEALALIRRREKPLALYIFSRDPQRIRHILENTSAGGTIVNHTILHAGTTAVPFGGVNQSGIGKYHGWYGFRELSNERALLRQGPFNVIRAMFPPYNRSLQARFMKLINRHSTTPAPTRHE